MMMIKKIQVRKSDTRTYIYLGDSMVNQFDRLHPDYRIRFIAAVGNIEGTIRALGFSPCVAETLSERTPGLGCTCAECRA